ncbi:outer membrane autotransporter barrel protein, partial [Burkholderia sp. SIMBA_057]
QVIWRHTSFDVKNDGLGQVDFGDDGTDWIVRQWTMETGSDRVWQPYGRVNLWHDWVAAEHAVWERPDSSARRSNPDGTCRRSHGVAFAEFQH